MSAERHLFRFPLLLSAVGAIHVDPQMPSAASTGSGASLNNFRLVCRGAMRHECRTSIRVAFFVRLLASLNTLLATESDYFVWPSEPLAIQSTPHDTRPGPARASSALARRHSIICLISSLGRCVTRHSHSAECVNIDRRALRRPSECGNVPSLN